MSFVCLFEYDRCPCFSAYHFASLDSPEYDNSTDTTLLASFMRNRQLLNDRSIWTIFVDHIRNMSFWFSYFRPKRIEEEDENEKVDEEVVEEEELQPSPSYVPELPGLDEEQKAQIREVSFDGYFLGRQYESLIL
uniref:BSD domain-containing protein n=1 Tax=Ascaris lumbricoides TaxID=6252 RepID=A0A0M3HF28_ASCLU